MYNYIANYNLCIKDTYDYFRVHTQISEAKILTFPDFILTKKSVYPDFQKPIKRAGDGVWP